MGESDNKPAGKQDLLEEDGTVWLSGGPTGSLDDDDDDLAEAPAPALAGTPRPAVPVQPFTRMASAPQAMPVALRPAPPADLADRPIATSGEMSSTPRGPTGSRTREPTPMGLAEPKIELDTSFGVVSDTPFGAPEAPYVAPERRSAPMTSMFGETGAVRQPALYPSRARWKTVALLALLALVIVAIVWRLATR